MIEGPGNVRWISGPEICALTDDFVGVSRTAGNDGQSGDGGDSGFAMQWFPVHGHLQEGGWGSRKSLARVGALRDNVSIRVRYCRVSATVRGHGRSESKPSPAVTRTSPAATFIEASRLRRKARALTCNATMPQNARHDQPAKPSTPRASATHRLLFRGSLALPDSRLQLEGMHVCTR